MERAQLQQHLRAGIAAVRRGDKAQGQALLLQVVQADEHNEAAWLWLAEAVTDPQDQLVALENVLTLNPNQPQARERVAALKQQLGLPPTPPPQVPPAKPSARRAPPNEAKPPAPAAGDLENQWLATDQQVENEAPALLPRDFAKRVEAAAPPPQSVAAQFSKTNPEEDPYQCVYCGADAPPEATRCPRCRKSLMAVGGWRDGFQQWALLMLGGLNLQKAFVQLAIAYVATMPETMRFWVLIPPGWLDNPMWAAALHVVLWAVVIWLSVSDLHYAYPVGAVVAAIDLAWAGISYQLGIIGLGLALVNGSVAGVLLLICLEANLSRFFASRRMKLAIDRNLSGGALTFHLAGRQHARAGKWALAALHFRRAIARNPRDPEAYKDLAQVQYQLKRYPQALKTLESALELAPTNAALKALQTKIRSASQKVSAGR